MTIEEINKICQNSLVSHLGIEFTGYNTTTVEARIYSEAVTMDETDALAQQTIGDIKRVIGKLVSNLIKKWTQPFETSWRKNLFAT
jgi:hypothetical protein